MKNVNKKRMATARRLIFLEFLKASIADLTSEGSRGVLGMLLSKQRMESASTLLDVHGR
jgi:hypothetical protein